MTIKNILMVGIGVLDSQIGYLKENYVDKSKLGVKSGEGFYTYPNPEFSKPEFLK